MNPTSQKVNDFVHQNSNYLLCDIAIAFFSISVDTLAHTKNN